MRAFWHLSSERQLGFTVGPIPYSAIHNYPGVRGMNFGMISLFEAVIQAMDNTYRNWAESERKKANNKGTVQPGGQKSLSTESTS